MRMLRVLSTAASCLLVTGAVSSSAQGSGAHQPETKAGLMAAAKLYAPESFTSTKNCIEIGSKSSVVSHGIALVAFSDMYRNNCTSGAWQVWAYTGSQWKPLSVYMQNEIYYTVNIPGKISICKGQEYTLIRSGPSLSAGIVGKVTSNTSAYATKVILTEQSFVPHPWSSSEHDGLAWYQITWHGKTAWVGSSRTMTPKWGCSHWTGGKVLGYH